MIFLFQLLLQEVGLRLFLIVTSSLKTVAEGSTVRGEVSPFLRWEVILLVKMAHVAIPDSD